MVKLKLERIVNRAVACRPRFWCWLSSALAAIMVGTVSNILDQVVSSYFNATAWVLDDVIVGMLAGALVASVKLSSVKRMENAAQINHEVRNALQILAFANSNGFSQLTNRERFELIAEAVKRIDESLKILAPVPAPPNNKSTVATKAA